MDKLALSITKTIDIDLNNIKNKISLTGCTVQDAVESYITSLDDSEYYLIGDNEKYKIFEALKEDEFED